MDNDGISECCFPNFLLPSFSILFILQVQDATKARLVFLVSVLIESEEMVIHVIGEEILDRELRFLVSVFVKIFYKIKKR